MKLANMIAKKTAKITVKKTIRGYETSDGKIYNHNQIFAMIKNGVDVIIL